MKGICPSVMYDRSEMAASDVNEARLEIIGVRTIGRVP
jgi:hypothetical protein